MMLASLLAPLFTVPSIACIAPQESSDWPHLRGPRLDGSANDPGLFETPFELQLAWKATLGPAYAGIAVADGRVVTFFSDGENDALVCLASEDGSELWRFVVGPTYLGHDGSEDGAISSPVIANGRVFGLGARGRLVALALEDGALIWSKQLVADLGATEPEYGFTTTVLAEEDVLVVQAGGSEGRMLCGLDAQTGELVWSHGDGEAAYQSPVAMELAGRRQVIVLNDKEILAVAPESGEALWAHPLGERDSASSNFPSAIDEERFVAPVSGALVAFRVQATSDQAQGGFQVEPLYRSRELGRGYAAPVYHDGHLYGFKSDFLTCIDAETGKRVWKSRPPGGSGLIRVGGRLVIFGAEGVVAVARATPEGYEEEARLQVLGRSSLVWPAFVGRRVFVRNDAELACIEIVPTAGAVAQAPGASSGNAAEAASAIEPEHDFGRFLRSVDTAEDPGAALASFLEQQETLPIVEGNFVHFVYQGEAEDVAIAGSMTGGRRTEALARVPGTNVFHRSYTIEPGARWEYRFQVDFDEWQADPRNSRTAPARWGDAPVSEVLTPGYDEPSSHAEEPQRAADERGRLDSFEHSSEVLGYGRTIQVYLPAGYDTDDAGGRSYPLLICQKGPDWIERGGLVNTLDNCLGASVEPLVVAFVPPIGEWWFEAGGTRTEPYLRMLAEELVPALAERYRLLDGPQHRALAGIEGFGLSAAYGVLLHGDVFGKAAVQSVALGDVARHAFFALLEEKPHADTLFYLDWNRYEARDVDGGLDLRADGQRLNQALSEAGYRVLGGEVLDGHGWGSWRARADDWLEALFPIE